MGHYVDGFVIPIPKRTRGLSPHRAQGRQGLARARRAGLRRVHRRRRKAGQAHVVSAEREAEAGEAVWFSYIVYKSRRHRDQVLAKVMKDPGSRR